MKKTVKKAVSSKTRTKSKAAVKVAKPVSKPAAKSASKPAGQKSLKKQYMKSSPRCKVTFRLPKEAAREARSVTVVGDFNNWSITENKMTRLKGGDFTLTLELPCDREYRFRYLIDELQWENDWFADKYVPNAHGSEDSVVVI